MYLKITERRNAIKHKINVCAALMRLFSFESEEYNYLQNRINFMRIKLHDSTYTL